MNKSELIEAIAASADIPKAAATRALDAMVESVTGSLKKGESVSLVGFGTFAIKERAARTGRNPQTGQPIQISAAKVPSFKAGKALKDAVNSFGSVCCNQWAHRTGDAPMLFSGPYLLRFGGSMCLAVTI